MKNCLKPDKYMLVSFITICITIGIFYCYLGSKREISESLADWGQFGEYFGGIAGTLLFFINIVMIAKTIKLQKQQIYDANDEVLKKDMLSHLESIENEIERVLSLKLAILTGNTGETVPFRDIVYDIVKPGYVNKKELENAVLHLKRIHELYNQAINEYEKKFNNIAMFKYHQHKCGIFYLFTINDEIRIINLRVLNIDS